MQVPTVRFRTTTLAVTVLVAIGCGGTRDEAVTAPTSPTERTEEEPVDAPDGPLDGTAPTPDPGVAREPAPAWTGAPPSCDAIETFARRMTDVGVTYDYDPSTSPSELASWVDVTVVGTLTGGVGGQEVPDALGDVYAVYEVAVSEVLSGDVGAAGDTLWVAVGHAPEHVDLDDLHAAVEPGIPVVVFGYDAFPGIAELADLTPAVMEGFATACDEGPLLGWAGSMGEWAQLETLEDVVDAVRAAEG